MALSQILLLFPAPPNRNQQQQSRSPDRDKQPSHNRAAPAVESVGDHKYGERNNKRGSKKANRNSIHGHMEMVQNFILLINPRDHGKLAPLDATENSLGAFGKPQHEVGQK